MELKNRRPGLRVFLLLAALLSVAGAVIADAPGGIFELDGNSVASALNDWDLLNPQGGVASGCTSSGGESGSSLIRSFCAGSNPPNIFTQGGSKDPNDTSEWVWKPRDTVPDKDTLTNAYAAQYLNSNNHQIFVFGAERFATNGDANIGIWFFRRSQTP